MNETSEATANVESSATGLACFQSLNWRKAALLVLFAVACFHAAYTPANPGPLALLIIGYVVCLVQLARLRTTRQCYYTALTVGLACFAPQLECFWRIFGTGAIALWYILAFWIAIFVVLVHLALVRLGPKWAALLVPFLWTGLEYFRSELYYLKFSWLNVGYAFAGWPFIPTKTLGMYGIGFAVLAAVLLFPPAGRYFLRKLTLPGLFILVYVIALFAALLIPVNSKLLRANLIIAGVQLESPSENDLSESLDKILASQSTIRLRGVRNSTNVGVIVLSEYTLDGEPTDDLKNWCRTNKKFLIVGGKDSSPGTNYYNTAFVISTNGEVVFKQAKSVPIQFSRTACRRRSKMSGIRRGARSASASATT